MSNVVVIGAGMSGIACARALQAEGVTVRLIDKGRGVGGRMSTRRAAVLARPLRSTMVLNTLIKVRTLLLSRR